MKDGLRDTGRNGSSHRRDKPRGGTRARADRQRTTGTTAKDKRGDGKQTKGFDAKGRSKQRGKKSRKRHAGRRAGEKYRNDAAMGALKATLERDLGMAKATKGDCRYKAMRRLIDRKLE